MPSTATQSEDAELRQKLQEAEEVLQAIQRGQVDSVIAMGPNGEQVYLLKGAEHPYRLLVEEMSEGAVTLNLDGTVLYCNQRFADMLGLAVEQVVGEPIASFVEPSDLPVLDGLLERCQRGQTQGQLCFTLANHGRLVTQVSARMWTAENVDVISMIVLDISERRRNEERLAYQARLLETVHDAIFATDERHVITFWNQAAEQMYGWKAAEAIGRRAFELLGVDLTEGQRADFRRVIAEAGRAESNVVHRRKDGIELDVQEITIPLKNATGRVTGYVSVNRDLTDWNRAVAALQESERRYRLLFELNAAGVFRIRLNTETLQAEPIECNSAYARMLGFDTADQMQGMPVSALFPSETDWHAFAERIAHDQALTNYECRMRRTDGAVIWALVNASAREEDDGHSILVEGTLVDITDQKRAQEELHASERRFHLAVDNFPGIFVIYDAERCIQFMNMPGIIMTGKPAGEIIGHTDEELFGEQATASYLPSLIKAAETGTVQSVEANLTLPAGAFISKITYVPLLDDLGKPQQILGIAEDISERKRVERALADQAELLDLTYDAVVVRDYTGTILFWNRGAEKMYGWTSQEVVGTHTNGLFQTKYPEPMEAITAALERDGHWEGELEQSRRDGSRIVVSSRWALKRDADGRPTAVLEISNDITEGKRAENALRISEERFRKIFDQAPIGVALVGAQASLLHVNGAFCQMLEYAENELRGRTLLDIIHPEDARQDAEWAHRLFRGDISSYDTETRYVTKNGRLIWAHVTATLIRDELEQTVFRVMMLEDITEGRQAADEIRRLNTELEARVAERTSELEGVNQALVNEISEHARAENALRTSEERFRLLADNAQDLIYRVRLMPERRFEYVSPSSTRVTGYPPEEFYSNPDLFFKLVHSEDLAMLEAIYRGEIASDVTVLLRLARKDGPIVWLEQGNVPVYDDENNLVAIEAIARDVTERKRAEEALQLANQNLMNWASQLEQRNREISLLNEMGDLLQSCITVEETFRVVENSARNLFPDHIGALYLLNNSKNLVEAVATWGDAEQNGIEHVFVPDHCWALRRGRVHSVHDSSDALVCEHVTARPEEDATRLAYVCVPMVAQGETLGTLFLQTKPENLTESRQNLAVSVAEHVALAISSLKLRETLRSQAIRDPLTGLFNRRYMEESLERELRRAARKHTTIAVVMSDLDYFKRFNDSYGHEAGDAILRRFGEFLLGHVREGDIACRYGGEEFTLILPEATLDEVKARMEELRRGFKQLSTQSNGKSFGSLSISIGIAIFPDHGMTAEALLRSADAALYRAKAQGRDRAVVASPA